MIEAIYLGSIFCALLNVYLLLVSKNSLRSFSNYILSLIFLLEVIFVVTYLLLYLGIIDAVPHLYKIPAPLNFLIPPLAYLYVRSILFKKNQISRLELLHFLPFIAAVINYLPFYLLSTEEKIIIIQKIRENILFGLQYQAGLIEENYLFYARTIQTFIYLIFQWRLIIRFKKDYQHKMRPHQVALMTKWATVFTGVFSSILVGFIFLGLLFSLQPQDHIFQLVTITQGLVLSISFFVLSSYILVNPSILIGLSLVKYNAPPTSLSKERAPRPIEIENLETSVRIVEDYMRSSKAYLNPNLTLAIVSVEVDIATKELSHIINNYYKIRFTDFVNQYRIGHFMDMLNNGKLDDYTIEALIKTAGFTSKSSFHSAFKKIHNCTPSQYIAAQKANLSA